MMDPHAGNVYHMPGSVALERCSSGQSLQTYSFTDADRTLLSDGAFHTFTVETGTTTLGIADGSTPICITFLDLSQYHLGTHVKSNADGTIPYLVIEGTPPSPPIIPQAPAGAVTVYTQSDNTGVMTNPQTTYLNSYIDSASLGNLNLGQGKLYITFTMKDPRAGNVYDTPVGISLESCASCNDLQKYFFTDADRTLLADQAFHTFMVETGTTTSTYADGTRPVFIEFFGLSQYQYGTQIKSNAAATIPALIIQTPPPPDPCIAAGTCVSNVLFLPGIEGSRLYRPNYAGGTDKLWEPNIDSDVKDLYMNSDGTSTRLDVYTKEGDVINELPDGENIYKSFIEKINDLKTNGTIADWEPIAYDWRLSLDDILTYGNDVQGRIYYSGDLRSTSTPYIIQELRNLAATSKTGKVTIVAHSNGGLLAKRLTELLGSAESAELIDKMIFVAVPQAGTPTAIAAGLHGYEQDNVLGLVTSKSTARTLASAAPMEYQLLPSAQYFTYIDDLVVAFDPSLTDWISRYGSIIHSQDRLYQFLTDTFGRVDPETGDINQPIQFNSALLSSAETLHASLDTWTPPTGVQLTQIAGWGVPKTVDGITYRGKGAGVTPEANFTIDGDGTVVVPSALWTSTTTGATNYWVDLAAWNRRLTNTIAFGFFDTSHRNIFEVPDLDQLISDQITNITKPLSDYNYLSIETPTASGKRLRYSLHSPLTLNLYDVEGRHTGISTSTGQVEEQIPGTYYTEFGDVKYLFSDASANANIIMNGYATGTFTFNVDEYSGNTLTTSTTFKDIPTTASTIVSLGVQSDISTLSSMMVDENGDGKNVFTITPKIGETVNYEPPAPVPESRSGSGGGGVYTPVIAAVSVATSTATDSTSSPQAIIVPIATTTPEVATSTEIAQIKKKVYASIVKGQKTVSTSKPKEASLKASQTASVYEVSQQLGLKKLAEAVYNGLHGFWLAIKSLF